jgi:hypothetical protein
MRKFVILLVVAVSVIFAAPASAHYYDDSYTNARRIGSAYEGHCGNGTLWICTGWPEEAWTNHYGAHSWRGWWMWREYSFSARKPRICQVEGRVEHGALVQIYSGENCFWLG